MPEDIRVPMSNTSASYFNPVSQLESLLNQTLGFFVKIESIIVKSHRVWIRLCPNRTSDLYLVYNEDGMMASIIVLTNQYLHALKLKDIANKDVVLFRAPNQEYVIVYDSPSYGLLGKILEFEKMIYLN
jgi:hypothetical protein